MIKLCVHETVLRTDRALCLQWQTGSGYNFEGPREYVIRSKERKHCHEFTARFAHWIPHALQRRLVSGARPGGHLPCAQSESFLIRYPSLSMAYLLREGGAAGARRWGLGGSSSPGAALEGGPSRCPGVAIVAGIVVTRHVSHVLRSPKTR